MAQLLKWHEVGDHVFEQGIDQVVLFPWDSVGNDYGDGVAWNGVVALTEAPVGADPNPKYADNRKYLTLYSLEELGLTLDAYMYPPEFEACDGTASPAEGMVITTQDRKPFGLVARTKVGNEVNADLGYKYRFYYGCKASPSQKGYQTIADSPDAITFSWNITTNPVNVTGFKPTPEVVVDSREVDPARLAALLEIVYGTAAVVSPAAPAVPARLPLPDEIASILSSGG